MALTFYDLCEKLKKVDEVSLLEVLEINSDELVDQFQDKIEEKFDELVGEFEE